MSLWDYPWTAPIILRMYWNEKYWFIPIITALAFEAHARDIRVMSGDIISDILKSALRYMLMALVITFVTISLVKYGFYPGRPNSYPGSPVPFS